MQKFSLDDYDDETHTEIAAYVRCDQTGDLVQHITALCEREGWVVVVPDPLAAPPKNILTIGVFPGVPGWQLLLTSPAPWLCEGGRFEALCRAAGAAGIVRDVKSSHYDPAMERSVTLEADGKGQHALGGCNGSTYDEPDTRQHWLGRELDPAHRYQKDARLIGALLPDDWVRDEAVLPQGSPARECGEYAQRLAGATSQWWIPLGGWNGLENAMQLGGPLPINGAILLSFSPIKSGDAYIVPDGYAQIKWPVVHTDPAGQPHYIGDIVELPDGTRGAVSCFLAYKETRAYPAEVHTIDGQSVQCQVDFLRFVRRRHCVLASASIKDLAASAHAGDAQAQAEMGTRYALGDQVPHNYFAAAYWWRQAADQGHPDAQCHLGEALQWGNGVLADQAAAREWLHMAARQNHVHAQCALGSAYAADPSLPNAEQEAQRWLRQAANGGSDHAQFLLAELLLREGDPVQANHWYRQAAAQKVALAMVRLGEHYEKATGAEQDYALAVEWYRAAAELGNSAAYYSLGACYRAARGVKADPAQAIAWFKKAVDLNCHGASWSLQDTSHNGRLFDLQTVPLAESTIAELTVTGAERYRLDAMVRAYLAFPILWQEGRVVWAQVLIADTPLYKEGDSGHVADVVYDPTGQADPEHIAAAVRSQLAMRASAEMPYKEMVHKFGLPVFDQAAHPGLLVSSMIIERRHFPRGYLVGAGFPILVSEKCYGVVMALPQRWWPHALFEQWQGSSYSRSYRVDSHTFEHMNPPRTDAGFAERAGSGTPQEQYEAGVCYASGDGVARNLIQGAACYLAAAERGYPAAQVAFGLMLQHGRGIESDLAGAARWIRQAANAGDAIAQAILGQMHEHGIGVAQTSDIAARYYGQAARQLPPSRAG